MSGNEKLEWTLTPLNEFHPDLKMRLPTKMPTGLINQSIDALVNIENRLETYELMVDQVNKNYYIFSTYEYEKWNQIYESEKQTLTSIKEEIVALIWKHRQNQINDDAFSTKLADFPRCIAACDLPDADFEHICLMEERIKEIEEWKKLGLQFVGSNHEMFYREITSPITYVFVFKDRSEFGSVFINFNYNQTSLFQLRSEPRTHEDVACRHQSFVVGLEFHAASGNP